MLLQAHVLELAALQRVCCRVCEAREWSGDILPTVKNLMGARAVALEKVAVAELHSKGCNNVYAFCHGGEMYLVGHEAGKGSSACVQIHTALAADHKRFPVMADKCYFVYDSCFDRIIILAQGRDNFHLHSIDLVSDKMISHGRIEIGLTPPTCALASSGGDIFLAALGEFGGSCFLEVHKLSLKENLRLKLVWSTEVERYPFPEYMDVRISCEDRCHGSLQSLQVSIDGDKRTFAAEIIFRKFDEKIVNVSRNVDLTLPETGATFGPIVSVNRRGKLVDVVRRKWGSVGDGGGGSDIRIETFLLSVK
ncbi:hypothetical protein FOL47_002181 [Perkinsus chesapeaki]|uniref:Uncharacterized protein n=1 Tax=Perkinsus chesapeaki TaxID=330153 RepID=A0A7J6MEW0_PERCH|nr:hypothetical protein FOL47_002181 [Perkinsus chesapeaki]